MKRIAQLYLFIIFNITFSKCYAIDTFWIDKTPSGYYFQLHDGGLIEYKNPQKEVILNGRSNFNWYFYKNHTVGYFSKNSHRKPSFFISNELKNSIDVFEDEKEWQSRISELNLKPKFWTRWFSDTWSFNPIEDSAEGLVFLVYLILFGRILIVVFIGFLISWFLRFKEIYVYWLKRIAILSCMIFGSYLVVNFLLCTFPQSI